MPDHFFLYHAGINYGITSGAVAYSSYVKLNRSGSGCPVGSLVFWSLNSLKNGSRSASNGLGLPLGSYTKSLATKSIASLAVLDLNTLSHGRGLIYGNLYSL